MRLTFEEVAECGEVGEDGVLRVMGREVGLVYYRNGYGEEQYGDRDWQVREMLELAMPIKCPSVDLHLTTFKKFQEAFNDVSLL